MAHRAKLVCCVLMEKLICRIAHSLVAVASAMFALLRPWRATPRYAAPLAIPLCIRTRESSLDDKVQGRRLLRFRISEFDFLSTDSDGTTAQCSQLRCSLTWTNFHLALAITACFCPHYSETSGFSTSSTPPSPPTHIPSWNGDGYCLLWPRPPPYSSSPSPGCASRSRNRPKIFAFYLNNWTSERLA